MRRYYVTVKDGQVIHEPKEIGSLHSDAPNLFWKAEQMALHGFVEVDLNYDKVTESIDLDNPVINKGSVTYPRITKDMSLVIIASRKRRILYITEQANRIIENKYSFQEILYVALGAINGTFGQELRDDVTAIMQSLKQAKSELSNLTTREQIEAYTHTFPII